MARTNRLRKWESAALIALCIALLCSSWAAAASERVSGSLVRLHVIADSDEAEEQAIKLRVRDAVLAYLEPKLEDAPTSAAAREIISGELDGIASAAESASEGRAVSVSLGEEYYPTRDYGTFALPAGRYESLRVTLGSGQGHNWWCVVFPPLCLGSVSETMQETALEAGLTENQVSLMTGEDEGYVVKFKAVELLEQFKGWLEGR